MSLTLSKIEELAPDQSSLAAAKKLLKLSTWPTLAHDGAGLVWGECQGSGATPYRISVTEVDTGYKCSCPSRKFPCKHSLALMWLWVENRGEFSSATVPEWVSTWLSRRRSPAVVEMSAESAKPRASIAAIEEPEVIVDPKAEARAAAARERNRLDRENAIANGLDELDIWLTDQLDMGIAAFPAKASAACRVMAQRLFDAKAPGLALRVDTIPTRLFAFPDIARPVAAIRELGLLHLLAEAYRKQDQLPELLRQDVRQALGWTLTRESLLDDQQALRVTGSWRVWAVISEVQPDKLRRRETWFYGSDRNAVLIEYVPVSTGGSSSGYSVGDCLQAELVFYPSSAPLRALVARQITGAEASDLPLASAAPDLLTAYGHYEDALIEKPWLGDYPLLFRGARLRRSGAKIYLTDQRISLPVAQTQSASIWPLLRFDALDGAGLWNGDELRLCWMDTALGRWTE